MATPSSASRTRSPPIAACGRGQVPALLAAGYRVLRADLRGHGGSDPAPGSYTMEQLVADTVALLDHLGIAEAHFCGLSIGGMIAQGVALLHPERVTSLILCDTRSASPKDAQRRWGPRIAEVQACNSMAPIADGTMARWLSPQCREANPSMWQQIRDTVAATSPQGYIGSAAAIQNFTWTERLHEISAPTLVMCGTDDPGADIEENREIARRVQNGEFLAIEGAFHLPNVEDPARFNQILITWCNKRQSSAASSRAGFVNASAY